jgi:alkaline phosphatase D
MLGPAQKAWLLRAVAASKATFKVVCSPVPWDFRTKGNSKDTWNGFRPEREEIFSSFEKNRIPGILLVSADRHRSDAWKIERESGYDLYEFNSSRLTNQHVHKTMKAALFSYNAKQSFGLIHFDTTLEDPRATYDVVTIDGEKVHSITVKLSQLQHR